MSPLGLVLAVAAVTVGSRVAALAVLPPPRGRAAEFVARLPAPLFAALAARWSSLLLTLVAGIGGYLVVSLLSG